MLNSRIFISCYLKWDVELKIAKKRFSRQCLENLLGTLLSNNNNLKIYPALFLIKGNTIDSNFGRSSVFIDNAF